MLKNVRIYRLVNAGRTSAYRALVVDRDLAPKEAWARLVEINKVEPDAHIFWSLSEELGEYLTAFNDQLEVCQNDLKQEESLNLRLREGVRNVQMEAVLNVLDCMGIHSTVEFPGYLNVEMDKSHYWCVGPIQDETDPTDYIWTGELHTVEGHIVGNLKVDDPTIRGLARRLYVEMYQIFEKGKRK